MANWSCQLWQLATAFDSGRAGFARQCRRVFEGDILFSSFSPSFRNANIWRIRYFVLALFALSFNCSIEHFPSVSSPFSDHKLLKWPLRLFSPLFIAFLLLSLFPNSLSLNSVNSVFCTIDLKKIVHTHHVDFRDWGDVIDYHRNIHYNWPFCTHKKLFAIDHFVTINAVTCLQSMVGCPVQKAKKQ